MSPSLLRHALAAAFTLALLAIVAVLGQVPLGQPSGKAVLRVSLRTVHGNAEICRELSEAELEALPQHMRQPRVCDEIAPPYRLLVSVDGRQLLDEEVSPGGLRGDRPLIVDRQITVEPGTVRLRVSFAPALDEPTRLALADAAMDLASYDLDSEVELVAERIALVTVTGARQIGLWDDDGRPAGR